MGAKVISLSADNVTYNVLPGSQGELSREGANLDDTIFGQDFRSGQTGLIGWQLNGNAVYKNYPGYMVTLKKPGTSTAMTDEAMTLVSGKTYQISAAAKQIWDRSVALTFEDATVAVDEADIESVDYLFGRVTFVSSYTPTGPITVSGNYLPTSDLGCATGYTLTQTADAIDTSCISTAAANNGHRTHDYGLKTVSLEVPTVYQAAADFQQVLIDRDEIIIEINPDGQGYSVARGFFKLLTDRQSGNVGALEEENLNFVLNVPYLDTLEAEVPFKWVHSASSPIPAAIKTALTGWETKALIWGKYLPDGAVGFKGEGVITNVTLSGAMDSMNTFQITLQGSDELIAVV